MWCRLDGLKGSHHGWCLKPVGEGRGWGEGAFACGTLGGSVEAAISSVESRSSSPRGRLSCLPPSLLLHLATFTQPPPHHPKTQLLVSNKAELLGSEIRGL